MDEANHRYKFTVPSDATYDAGDSIYVSIESYYSQVVPNSCFKENSNDQRGHALVTYRVDNVTPNGAHNYAYIYSEDYTHSVVEVPVYDAGSPDDGGFTPGDDFTVEV